MYILYIYISYIYKPRRKSVVVVVVAQCQGARLNLQIENEAKNPCARVYCLQRPRHGQKSKTINSNGYRIFMRLDTRGATRAMEYTSSLLCKVSTLFLRVYSVRTRSLSAPACIADRKFTATTTCAKIFKYVYVTTIDNYYRNLFHSRKLSETLKLLKRATSVYNTSHSKRHAFANARRISAI